MDGQWTSRALPILIARCLARTLPSVSSQKVLLNPNIKILSPHYDASSTAMQKVIRRTLLAERQAARRRQRGVDKEKREWNRSNLEQTQYQMQERSKLLKQSRLNRREDWELGLLAPKRDVGNSKETYGTINANIMRGPELNPEDKTEALKPFGGGFLNLVKGDRVVILEGRDKGKIGKILEVDKARAECTVEGLNMVDVQVPRWMLQSEDSNNAPVRTVEQGIALSSVRLVYPLRDEETGITRDVIIKKLVNGPVWHDRHAGTYRWSRLIAGLNIKVPWPKVEPKEHPLNQDDTQRLDVEVRNFVPTLLRPPMPSSVIDELRNKYSVFRKRHDEEYIERKMAEDREKEEMKKKAKLMMTPTREANRKARKEKRKLGKGALTPEMLQKIGQVIAQNRPEVVDADATPQAVTA